MVAWVLQDGLGLGKALRGGADSGPHGGPRAFDGADHCLRRKEPQAEQHGLAFSAFLFARGPWQPRYPPHRGPASLIHGGSWISFLLRPPSLGLADVSAGLRMLPFGGAEFSVGIAPASFSGNKVWALRLQARQSRCRIRGIVWGGCLNFLVRWGAAGHHSSAIHVLVLSQPSDVMPGQHPKLGRTQVRGRHPQPQMATHRGPDNARALDAGLRRPGPLGAGLSPCGAGAAAAQASSKTARTVPASVFLCLKHRSAAGVLASNQSNKNRNYNGNGSSKRSICHSHRNNHRNHAA